MSQREPAVRRRCVAVWPVGVGVPNPSHFARPGERLRGLRRCSPKPLLVTTRSLEGMPVIEQAIAPVNIGNVPTRQGHSMIRTEMQEEMEELKKRARELTVPDDRH